ncbi:DUF2332 family protein [Aliiroseovarius subalbicans]|uniref:DUF2332 domain-containing protein n=1 Tax=Aliiroseovarius subalbicans TaxID=2925840 RepID=UPI001F597B8C|nr:DUF2332 family protein [Aliiroseovarius subalbicans]MCI2400303.1 DUF2332 family protein [Aliiroseovarius subalbicans]
MSLRDALRDQAGNNESLGSPFTARVLRLLADRMQPGTPLTDRMFAWPGDLGPYGDSVPLRLLGGLHGLVLSGAAPDLVAAYPPNAVDDTALWAALSGALNDHAGTLSRWLDSPPQTNELRRSAVLIAGGAWLANRFDLPIEMSELGASAGLNLIWDRFALDTPAGRIGPDDAVVTLSPEWRGNAPEMGHPTIVERRGVDLMPMDAQSPDDALRLMSYLWADQSERLSRTRAALAVADVPVDAGDAADWLETRLAGNRPDALHLVYHTVAWQYFPEETKARCLAAMEQAGTRGPVARLAMEADDRRNAGAAITLTLWPEGRVITLGRVDFHGRWVDWRAT